MASRAHGPATPQIVSQQEPAPRLEHPKQNPAHYPVSEDKEGVNSSGFKSSSSDSEATVPEQRPRVESIPTRKKKSRHRYFGLGKGVPTLTPQPQAFNMEDYEQKYPEDKPGEELGPSARFYRVYLDEHEKFRFEMVEGWKDSLDVLLVFAGLFSAVVTTIVVEASKGLQPDYAQITTALLVQQSTILSHMLNLQRGVPISDPPLLPSIDTSFTPSNNARWVNGLWFTSLALSLATALIAVVAKQWLQSYMVSPTGTPQGRARLLHLRYISLEKWRVPGIVGLLPFLLHFSLLLFFCGLVIYLVPIDQAIGATVGSVALACYLAYFVAALLPLFIPTCAYKTSLSNLVYSVTQLLLCASTIAEEWSLRLWHPWLRQWQRKVFDISHGTAQFLRSCGTLAAREQHLLKRADYALAIDQEIFEWMYSFSFSPSATSITVQAACAPNLLRRLPEITARQLWTGLHHELEQSINTHAHNPFKCDRLVRSLGSFVGVLPDYSWQWGAVSYWNFDGVRLQTSAWISLIRGSIKLSSELALLWRYPARFSSYWQDSPSIGDLHTIRRLILSARKGSEELRVSEEDRRLLLHAIPIQIIHWWGSLYEIPDLFKEMKDRLETYWDANGTAAGRERNSIVTDFHLQLFVLAAVIVNFHLSMLSRYQVTDILNFLDNSVRDVCQILYGMGDDPPAVDPTADCCVALLTALDPRDARWSLWYTYGLSASEKEQIQEIKKYAQEHVALYKSRKAVDANVNEAEQGLSRLIVPPQIAT